MNEYDGEKMGIKEKIAKAKESTWLSEGLSKHEIKSIVELAQISVKITKKRLEMNMTQSMVSK